MSGTLTRPSTTANTGRGIDRIDGPLKVTGAARYAADAHVDHPLFAVMVQSTISRGRITEIDETATRAVEGVVDVLTFRNAPRLQPAKLDQERGTSFTEPQLIPLQTPDVRYWGQHVAAVIATTLEAATAAAALLRIEYETLPASVTLNALTRTRKARVNDFMGTPLNVERGDAEAGLATATVHVDVTYTTPAQTHNAMEPSATVAFWSGNDLTVYDATQWINGTQNTLAQFFDIDPQNVHVISPFLGGGFGSKGFSWPHTAIAAMAAKITGKTVKLVIDRSQFFTSNGHRSETEQRLRIGASDSGKITGLVHDVIDTSGTAGSWVESCNMITQMLYAVPNLRTTHDGVKLDISTPTAMRAPGETPGTFALESALDELAYAANIDPIELRIRNHADVDPSSGLPWSSKHLLECYAEGARRFGWHNRTPAPRSMRAGNDFIGYGMATASYPAMAGATEVCVRVDGPGSAVVECATHDLGTGMYTIIAQVASDTLGIPLEAVTVNIGDSRLPKAPVAGGSQSTASVMPPLIEACSKLKQLAGGDLSSAQPGLEARASSKGESDEEHYSFHSFGAQFCEVRFDEELAHLRVTRFTSVFDCGRIINPKTARSQMIGGITMGLGMALMEETLRDERTGAIVTNNLADYHVPVNADVPAFDIAFVDHPDLTFNTLGVRGVGEIGITGVAAAVANAVYHASGRRVRDLPIVPERLM
jgi:xanthine dehydrogenase YagR molybdenum-binding subunit